MTFRALDLLCIRIRHKHMHIQFMRKPGRVLLLKQN
jgi:hypothetical protein